MDEILEFCRLFDIDRKELSKKVPLWRFDTLYVRGVDKLTSEEVYDYFGEIHPHSVEWLSNISCNVSFASISKANNALMVVGLALIESKRSVTSNVGEEILGLEVRSPDSLEIPVPPNYRYVLGVPHPKAKAIIIRYATINDVKVGNFASKISMMGTNAGPEIKLTPATQIDKPLVFENNGERILMKMRADEEVEKQLSQRINRHQNNNIQNRTQHVGSFKSQQPRRSVFDRLGKIADKSRSDGRTSVFDRLGPIKNQPGRNDPVPSAASRAQTGRIQKASISTGRDKKNLNIWSGANFGRIQNRLSRGGGGPRQLPVYDDDDNFN